MTWGLGIAGEAGDVAGCIKKTYTHKDDQIKGIRENLGDTIWYVAMICNFYGWNLEDIIQESMDELSKRYPNGPSFDNAKKKRVDWNEQHSLNYLIQFAVDCYKNIFAIKYIRRFMAGEKTECCTDKNKMNGGTAASGGIYGLAFIGSLIYFLQHADSLWMGLLGILKAIVWPAILVYKFLEFLKL